MMPINPSIATRSVPNRLPLRDNRIGREGSLVSVKDIYLNITIIVYSFLNKGKQWFCVFFVLLVIYFSLQQ